ncbi:unnamed protein product [Wickerhamomyces anomalus]
MLVNNQFQFHHLHYTIIHQLQNHQFKKVIYHHHHKCHYNNQLIKFYNQFQSHNFLNNLIIQPHHHHTPQKRSFNEFNSQTPYNNVSKKQQYESVYNTPTKIASISNYNMLTPIKSSYMTSNNHNTGVMIDNNYPINYNIQPPPPPPPQHPLNCSCCALTNFTNCYHSSLKSMVKL